MDPLRLLTSISILLLGTPCGIIWAQATTRPSPTAAPQLPVPSPTSTPIEFFRHLLAATPTRRATILAGKSPEHRRVLENSLRSYDSLPPEQRESRLHNMELRYRLTALLRMAPSNRVDYLKRMPDGDRPLLEE